MRQSDTAYDRIKSAIIEGEFAPGRSLAEIPLSAELGVSRTPIRQALDRLAHEGLVEQVPGRTAIVAPISIEDVVAQFQARDALEVYSLQLAARASDRTAFTDLAARLRHAAQRQNIDSPEIYELSAEFEALVDETADSRYIRAMLTDLRLPLRRLRRLMRNDHERLRASAEQHAAIAEAVAVGSAELVGAASAVWLQDSLSRIIEILTDALDPPITNRFPLQLPTSG